MTQSDLLTYSLAKKGAHLEHPFGPGSDIVKVGHRIFIQLFELHGVPVVTFIGDPLRNEFYRSLFPDHIRRGYHCPPVSQPFFNTVDLTGEVPDALLLEMTDLSYAYAVSKLPRAERETLKKA